MDLEAMKAAFLAKGGKVTEAPAAPAYGVDPAVDKAKRAQVREAAWMEAFHGSEHEAEIAFQRGVEENGYFKS